jgi:chorismate-pyruvate lyase
MPFNRRPLGNLLFKQNTQESKEQLYFSIPNLHATRQIHEPMRTWG